MDCVSPRGPPGTPAVGGGGERAGGDLQQFCIQSFFFHDLNKDGRVFEDLAVRACKLFKQIMEKNSG